MKILTNYDLNQNQLLNARVQNLASAPSNPVKGQVYFNTTSNRLFCYNGTDWVGADSTGATMTGSSIVTEINSSAGVIDLDNLAATVGTAVTNSHTHGNKTTLDNITAAYTTAEASKLAAIEAGAEVNNISDINATDLTDGGATTLHKHSYADLDNKPSSSTANIDDAVSKRHTQNTDTGTSSATFTVGTSGVKIKNSGGTELQVRNTGDTDYADVRVKNLYVEGTTTTINSNTIEIGDNEIVLNSDITTNAANSDGGIAVKRLMADNTTRKDAKIIYDASSNRWETVQGAVANALITAEIANKVVFTVGNAAATSFVLTHNLNTRDVTVQVRETGSPYEIVLTDVVLTSLDTITVSFAVAPTSNQYTVTIIG